jgi:GNAT superfamily N-acetyltransferase
VSASPTASPFATRDPRTFLRFATADDLPTILALIRGLAEYEKLLAECVADEAALARTLFGERRYAEVVIAEHEGTPAGFALFFHNYSTFLARPGIYLEDLFVLPDLRGRGIGEILLAFLARLAVEHGCGRFEWSVLDWNEPAIEFYKRLGAVAMDEWTVFRVTGDALTALAARFGPSPP